jgi:hypothetical protein
VSAAASRGYKDDRARSRTENGFGHRTKYPRPAIRPGSRAHDDQSRAPLSGFPHDNGRGRTRVLLDHQAAHIFGRQLHMIDEGGRCHCVVSDVEDGNGGII